MLLLLNYKYYGKGLEVEIITIKNRISIRVFVRIDLIDNALINNIKFCKAIAIFYEC